MLEGVDYSFSRPGGAALAAAGKYFAVRYLYDGGKGLKKPELLDLQAHGIAVAVVYESTASRALAGVGAGRADADKANKLLFELGLPALPIYFAVDFDASAAQQSAIDDYLLGAGSVIGKERVGIYGSFDVVTRSRDHGTATYLWQTYAWSKGRVASNIHLYQYKNGQTINGASVDFCRAMQDNYGQFLVAGGSPSAPLPAPSPIPQHGGLAVDGVFGPGTVRALQLALNATGSNPKLVIDGNFGPGSKRALQLRLNATNGPVSWDGIIGPATVRALQKHVGAVVDGNWGPNTTKALQRTLNAGAF